ncbi:threonyl-tRNA synthetase [Xylaria cf. heliscus]|nr:threonyl-tRNA synthetase [Xylaria cf. heliscus]
MLCKRAVATSLWPRISVPLSRIRDPRLLSPFVSNRSCSSHATATATATATTTATATSPLSPLPPDHRDLAIKQELFTTSPYSPGCPILLPNGARIFNRLVEFLRQQYTRYGFDEVITPTIYKKALWRKSGHLQNYSDDMFTVTSTSLSRKEESSTGGPQDEYGLKPMNCPGHCVIFASQRRSYRDLPIRYADFSPLHRNEISGALSGLTRLRRFHQDDGHIFCRPSQIEEEILNTLNFVRVVYSTFKLGSYRLTLSTRPADNFVGTDEEWETAEGALKRALDASGELWTINKGDGAFYGPKIDIILRDSDGKEHQTATIQLDFQMPKRFDLVYTTPAPEYERRGETTTDPVALDENGFVTPVLIHRAVLGSVERLMALLIEHYNGTWPFWLNPRQVMIVTVNNTQPVIDHAKAVQDVLIGRQGSSDKAVSQATGLVVDIDDRPLSVGAKFHKAKAKGYTVILTAGPRQLSSGTITCDLSGLEGEGEGEASKRENVDMLPSELLGILKAKANAYL